MPDLRLELELEDISPLRQIFGSEDLLPGQCAEGPAGGFSWKLESLEEGVGFLESTVAVLVVSAASSIAINVISSAIYDLLSSRVRRLRVDGASVRIRPDELEEAIRRVLARKGAPSE